MDATKGCAPIPSEVGSTRPVIVRPNHQVDFRSSLYFYYIETRCIVSYPRSGPESNRGHTHAVSCSQSQACFVAPERSLRCHGVDAPSLSYGVVGGRRSGRLGSHVPVDDPDACAQGQRRLRSDSRIADCVGTGQRLRRLQRMWENVFHHTPTCRLHGCALPCWARGPYLFGPWYCSTTAGAAAG